ncbi:MAG: NAD-glutamate dehydrogenase, partial [Actinocrinis sp.]
MVTQLDEAKAGLLTEAAELARDSAAGGEGAGPDGGDTPLDRSFLDHYYWHVPFDDLADRTPADVLGAVRSSRELAGTRPQGTAKIRVWTPTREKTGWTTGETTNTLVEIAMDDMPFLVDSVTAELTRLGHGIHVLLHPVFAVERDLVGRLLTIGDHDPGQPGAPGSLSESWMHIEIDRQADDPERLAAIEKALRRVLSDVREAVEDWPKMRAVALSVAEGLEAEQGEAAQRGGVSYEEVTTGQELLRWLADAHFTFLGYREYTLAQSDGDDVLRPITGTGLGILRSDQPHGASGSFAKLPPEVRAKAREPHLLVLTKANSRATVHRPGYLDYIGVKRFDAEGRVVGERRFLGLFSAAAYSESVQRVPVIRQKVRQVLDAHGFGQTSHSGKDLLQILESYPRDDLFQIPVDELAVITGSVLHLQERRRLRLFLRKDAYGRYFSALVYLPRDRYTTDARLKLQEILLKELDGAVLDYTVRSTESVLTRLHFVVRVAPGKRLADVDGERIERLLAAAIRTWEDAFAQQLTDSVGPERAAELLRD